MWSLGRFGRFRAGCRPVWTASCGATKRCASTLPDSSPNLIILNPREAGLVRSKPRRPRRRAGQPAPPMQVASLTPLDSLSGLLHPSESVVSAIHSQRPESASITQQRFEQIRDELAKGFKKSHLEDYLRAQKVNPDLFKRLNKPKLAQLIMTGVWKCAVHESQQSGGGVFVENVLELSEMEFVLVLGRNGRLLREWSKSGARIAISPSRNQIIVNSTQETFDWINASLSSFLETTTATEIDIAELKQLVDTERFPEHLAAIQQLTDTYFRGTGTNDATADSIVVYSAGDGKIANTNLVKRLLVQLIQPAITKLWKPDVWWFDVSTDSIERSSFHPFDDTDSLEWMERMRDWRRWEAVKTKGKPEESADRKYEMRCLKSPEFSQSNTENDLPSSSLSSQLEGVVQRLIRSNPVPKARNNEPVSATLTVTPGYVLHQAGEETAVPHAGMPKAFSSNIPFVSNLSSTLPQFAKDVQQADYPASVSSDGWRDILNSSANDSSSESRSGGALSDLLNLTSEESDDTPKVYANRRKDLQLSSNLRLIQMKFIANPQQGLATEYPPVEAWAELPPLNTTSNSLLQQVPRLVAVPLETNAHFSLPDQKADLKATLAYTYPIPITHDVEHYFMKKCRFGRLGPLEIGPGLELEFEGQKVSYLYHSSAYVTLTELEFRGCLLQYSQVEGGKLGGRKVEASIIEHQELAEDLDAEAASSRAIQNALTFTQLM